MAGKELLTLPFKVQAGIKAKVCEVVSKRQPTMQLKPLQNYGKFYTKCINHNSPVKPRVTFIATSDTKQLIS